MTAAQPDSARPASAPRRALQAAGFALGTALLALFGGLPFAAGLAEGYSAAATGQVAFSELDAEALAALRTPTDELVSRGRRVFGLNCASCHGPEGRGDGAAARLLTIKPRDFSGPPGDWKNGLQLDQILGTLEHGLTKMPPFPGLPIQDRHAVAHYIRTELVPRGPVQP